MAVRATRWVVLPLAFTVLAIPVGGPSLAHAADDAAQSPLLVRVTTDRSVYRLRRPVLITLTETNTSDHEVWVAFGCQILHGFITHDGERVWTFRDFRLCATGEGMLQSGASRTLGLFWNGRPNPGVELEPGVYVVHAGVDGVTGTATIRLPAETAAPNFVGETAQRGRPGSAASYGTQPSSRPSSAAHPRFDSSVMSSFKT